MEQVKNVEFSYNLGAKGLKIDLEEAKQKLADKKKKEEERKKEFEKLKQQMEEVQVAELPKTTPKALTNVKVVDEDDIDECADNYDDDQIEDETPVRDDDFIDDNYDDDVPDKEVADADEGIDLDYSQT